jgi:hypothetical protein
MSRTDEIKQILADATRQAYKQGWDDAMAALKKAATSNVITLTVEENAQEEPAFNLGPASEHIVRRRGRPNASTEKVAKVIGGAPGMSGAQVVGTLPGIHERTIRTALRRLRLTGRIEQRNGGWYPVSGG